MKASLYHDLRSVKTDGTYPIKIAINHRGKTSYISTGLSVKKNQFVKLTADGNHIVSHPKQRKYNSFLKTMLFSVENEMLNLQSKGKGAYGAKAIRDEIVKTISYDYEDVDTTSFFAVFDKFVSLKTKPTTIEIYKHTRSRLVEYLKGRTMIAFEDIDARWLQKFNAWLESDGSSVNTRSIHMRNIRAVFNYAIDEEITQNYPFRKFKIKSEATMKRSLSVDQLSEIWSTRYDDSVAYAIDIFKLTFYLIGINYIDLHELKEENIVGDRIEYRRSKTGKKYSVKIEPEAMEIIKRHSGKNGYLIDLKDRWSNYKNGNHRINELLKKVDSKLTTYWARHSWATIAANNDIPIETIASALGHSYGNATTSIYIDLSLEKVDKANRTIIDILTKKLAPSHDDTNH